MPINNQIMFFGDKKTLKRIGNENFFKTVKIIIPYEIDPNINNDESYWYIFFPSNHPGNVLSGEPMSRILFKDMGVPISDFYKLSKTYPEINILCQFDKDESCEKMGVMLFKYGVCILVGNGRQDGFDWKVFAKKMDSAIREVDVKWNRTYEEHISVIGEEIEKYSEYSEMSFVPKSIIDKVAAELEVGKSRYKEPYEGYEGEGAWGYDESDVFAEDFEYNEEE